MERCNMSPWPVILLIFVAIVIYKFKIEPGEMAWDREKFDQALLDIARHESLTAWHSSGRSILRPEPVWIRGSWDVSLEEWGQEISQRYEEMKLAGLSAYIANRRLRRAQRASEQARKFYG